MMMQLAYGSFYIGFSTLALSPIEEKKNRGFEFPCYASCIMAVLRCVPCATIYSHLFIVDLYFQVISSQEQLYVVLETRLIISSWPQNNFCSIDICLIICIRLFNQLTILFFIQGTKHFDKDYKHWTHTDRYYHSCRWDNQI